MRRGGPADAASASEGGDGGRRRGSRAAPSRLERGSVTAELAVALPGLVVVLVAVLLAASAGLTHVRCQDAARAAARAAAIGDDPARVRAVAVDLAGPDAVVSVGQDGAWVVVDVARDVRTGWSGWSISVSAEARAWIEPGESP